MLPNVLPNVRLSEGLDETLTHIGLEIGDALYKTLRTTNLIENLNGLIGHYTRNMKRWRDGQMVLRGIVTSLAQARRGFRAVRGYRDMKKLVAALARAVPAASDGKLKVA